MLLQICMKEDEEFVDVIFSIVRVYSASSRGGEEGKETGRGERSLSRKASLVVWVEFQRQRVTVWDLLKLGRGSLSSERVTLIKCDSSSSTNCNCGDGGNSS